MLSTDNLIHSTAEVYMRWHAYKCQRSKMKIPREPAYQPPVIDEAEDEHRQAQGSPRPADDQGGSGILGCL